MKKYYVLIIFAVVFGLYGIVKGLSTVRTTKINPFVYPFLERGWVDTVENANKTFCVIVSTIERKQTYNWQSALLEEYINAHKKVTEADKKVEIVYVRRMSSAFIMNSPAFYKRDIGSNNTITRKGGGADEQDITVILLSDGHVIKASPRSSAQWLGVTVGGKVRKTTYKWFKFNKPGIPFDWEDPIGGIGVKDTIVYQPLYQ